MDSQIRRKYGFLEEERFQSINGEELPVPIVFPNHRYSMSRPLFSSELEPLPQYQRTIAVSRFQKIFRLCKGSGLRRCVKSVVAGRSIQSDGVELGGVAQGRKIYMAVTHGDVVFSDFELGQLFYHELGHSVLNQVDSWLVEMRWQDLLPSGFKYPRLGFNAVQNGKANPEFSRDWLEYGFISQYSATCFDEDFCMIAQFLYAGTRDFWQAADSFPLILQKVRRVIEVYRLVGFQITEESARENFARGF